MRSAKPIAVAVACAIGVLASSMARADIYTWVDAAGSLNVSNVPPPDGVTISKIVPDSPPRPVPPPGVEADARRQAQVQMLAERVQQLERQVATAPPSQPVVMYAPPPSNAEPQVQYAAYEGPQAYTQNASCDPSWTDCGTWPYGIPYAPPYAYYPPYYYPASVIVVRNTPPRRFDPPGRNMPPRYGWQGGNRSPMPMPIPSPRPSPNIVGMRTR